MDGESNNSGNTSLYINALDGTANWGIGFMRSSTLRGYLGFNDSNDLFVNVGALITIYMLVHLLDPLE